MPKGHELLLSGMTELLAEPGLVKPTLFTTETQGGAPLASYAPAVCRTISKSKSYKVVNLRIVLYSAETVN